MQTLTYDEVIEACRKAYDNGTLLALANERQELPEKEVNCQYVYHEYRCAIGAALNESSLEYLDEHPEDNTEFVTIVTFIRCGNDRDKIATLQELHDGWMAGSAHDRQLFLNAIGR